MSFSVYDIAAEALLPPEKLSVEDWLRQNVILDETTAFPGPLDVRNSPWLIAPFQDLANHSVREIVLTCAVQSGKTTFLEGGMLYWIAQVGGDLGLYLQTDDGATRFLHKRFKRKILNCDAVAKLLTAGQRSVQRQTVDYVHMTQYVLGAENIHNVQSYSLKSIWADEAAYWKKDRISESRKRTTAFDRIGSKRVYIGTPLDVETEYHEAFLIGTRGIWNIRCPECGHLHAPKFNYLKWDSQAALMEDGRYNPAIIRATTRYVCPNCAVELPDEPLLRRKIADSGVYVNENPAPDPKVRSYHWNCIPVPWIEWGDMAVEFTNANTAKKLGDLGPLREFITKKLAEFWDPRLYEQEAISIKGGFAMLEPWDKEEARFLTVDVQRDYFRIVVRLWAKDGSSRLYWAGRLDTWGQIRDFQLEHKIKDGHVLVDYGYNSQEVTRECAKFGWWPVKGDGASSYSWHRRRSVSAPVETIRRPYIKQKFDTGQGLHSDAKRELMRQTGGKSLVVNTILWSSEYMKRILIRLRSGRGAPWLVANDAPKFYLDEITNEIISIDTNKKTGHQREILKRIGPNHAFDAEAMSVLAAYISKMLGQTEGDDNELGAEPVDSPHPSDA